MKSTRKLRQCLLAIGLASPACIISGHPALSAQPPSTTLTQPTLLFSAGVSYTSVDGQGSPKFPLIDLLFNLHRPDGASIPTHPDELALYSQGQPVGSCTGIRTFDRTGYGTSTVIALDASSALRTLTPNAVNVAVFTVVHDGVKQDTTAVTTLAEDFFVDLPFHPGPRVWKANAPLFPQRGKATHLYDGLLQATSLFTPTLPRRRILLVIADGQDSGSQHTPLDLLTRVKSLGIEIDTIAINTTTSATSATAPTTPLAVLQQLSIASGGTYALAHNGDELQQMIALHLSAVRATPVAEFELSHLSSDGQIHALQLRWLSGNLSTPAFLTAPAGGSSHSFFHLPSGALLSNPWLLAFGGCFFVGLCLLFLSMIPSRPAPAAVESLGISSESPLKPISAPNPFPFSQGSPFPIPGAAKPLHQPRYIEDETERRKLEFARRFNAPPQGPYARLVIRNNALAGRIVSMTRPTFSIGALPGNDLALPEDVTISGTHLRFYWHDATLTVEDNHSTNGTYLNRQRLPAGRHSLKPGDEIGLGQTFLVVERA
jgi:hypothetical protein